VAATLALGDDADSRILRGGIELGVWAGLGYLLQNIGLVGCDASHASVMSSFTVIAVPVIACCAGRVVPSKTWLATVGALVGLAVMEGMLDVPMMTAAEAATQATAASEVISESAAAAAAAAGSTDNDNHGVAYVLASALFFGVHIFRTDVIFGDEGPGATEQSDDDDEQAAVDDQRLPRQHDAPAATNQRLPRQHDALADKSSQVATATTASAAKEVVVLKNPEQPSGGPVPNPVVGLCRLNQVDP
jgi:hypothetical protein